KNLDFLFSMFSRFFCSGFSKPSEDSKMSSNGGSSSYKFGLLIVVLAIFIFTRENPEEIKKVSKTSGDRLFTAEELSMYDGNRSTRI